MPNLTERFQVRFEDDIRDRPPERWTRFKVLVESNIDIFRAAGFGENHTSWLTNYNYQDSLRINEYLSPEVARFYAEIVASPHLRNYFFDIDAKNLESEASFTHHLLVLKSIRDALDKHPGDAERQKIATDTRQFIDAWRDLPLVKKHRPYLVTSMAIQIISTPAIYKLFGSNPSGLANRLYSKFENERIQGYFDYILRDKLSGEGLEQLQILDLPIHELLFLDAQTIGKLNNCPGLLEIARRYANSPQTWADRLIAIDECFNFMGLGLIKDSTVNELLLLRLAQQKAEDLVLQKHPAVSGMTLNEVMLSLNRSLLTLTGSQRYSILVGIREKLGYSGLTKVINSYLQDPQIFLEVTGAKINELKMAVKRARQKESPYNPLVSTKTLLKNGFETELGYKVEQLESSYQGAVDLVFPVLRCVGLNQGNDGLELAPGPFWDPETAIAIFDLSLDARLTDYHLEVGQTYHFNISLRNKNKLHQIIWGIILTGIANSAGYCQRYPFSEEYKDQELGLDVSYNTQGEGMYVEAKAFSTITPEGFRWTHRAATKLAIALNAYETLCQRMNIEVDRTKLHLAKATELEKKLAAIYLDYLDGLKEGADQVGLSGIIHSQHLPINKVRFIHRQIELVYNGVGSRYDPLPAEVDQGTRVVGKSYGKETILVEPVPVTIASKNKTYPTILHFSQDLINATVNQIDAALEEFDDSVRERIREIDMDGSKSTRKRKLTRLLKVLNTPLPPKPSTSDYEVAYQKVKDCYDI